MRSDIVQNKTATAAALIMMAVMYAPSWFSDEVCKAVTGVGNSKRRFYTNDEDVIYNYIRCLMINGINNTLTL